MYTKHHRKSFSTYLPWLLTAVLVVVAVGVVISLRKTENSTGQGKPVIDLNQPVTKNPDSVNTVQLDSGGGKKEMVQVRFSWEVGGIKYNDALVMTQEEYDKLTPEKLEALKTERFTNWAKMVNEQSRAEF